MGLRPITHLFSNKKPAAPREETNLTARLGAAIERAGRAALQQLSSPPSIKQMSLLCLMRERRKSWLVELRGPLHWKSKIFKLRPPHPAVKPINSINWIMAGGPSSSTNTFNPFFPLGRKEWNWIVCCCWSGPFNLALQLLNKSISRCSIALLFNN